MSELQPFTATPSTSPEEAAQLAAINAELADPVPVPVPVPVSAPVSRRKNNQAPVVISEPVASDPVEEIIRVLPPADILPEVTGVDLVQVELPAQLSATTLAEMNAGRAHLAR